MIWSRRRLLVIAAQAELIEKLTARVAELERATGCRFVELLPPAVVGFAVHEEAREGPVVPAAVGP